MCQQVSVSKSETMNDQVTCDSETLNSEHQFLLPKEKSSKETEIGEKQSLLSNKKSSKHKSTIRILSLVILAFSEFLGGCTLSILAPFYSKEASDHGLSVAASGSVFASIFVVQIIFVPIFGKLLSRIGSTRLFISGVLLAGATNVAFGFLPRIKSGEMFLVASLLTRSVTAVGEAAMNTAILPLARRRGGPGRECSVVSWMETMNGMGTTLGPFVGGVLFNYGGFCFPFAISGGLLVLCGLVAALVLDPSVEKKKYNEKEEEYEDLDDPKPAVEPTFWTLICSSSVFLSCVITIATGAGQQWYQPSLEPYVREQFGLNPFQTSMLFIIDGGVYALVSPVVGFLLDRCLDPRLSILTGTTTICLGYLLLGPLPPFFMDPSIAQICVGAALHGLGMSLNFMGTLTLLSNVEREKGESTEKTAGMMTSLWITGECLGNFIGAAAGGAVFDRLGWRISCLVVASIQLLGVLIIVIVWAHQNYREAKRITRVKSKPSKDDARTGLLAGKKQLGYGACEENNNCIDV